MNHSPSEALAVQSAIKPAQFDLSPQTFEQALQFAEYLAASELVPKQFRGKPGDCLIAMQWGYEVDLKPLQALNSIAVINGKPGLYGDAGKAILLSKGCIIDEDDIAVIKQLGRGRCKITRPGRPPVERTFSLDDAKVAGLLGKDGPWKTYPQRQMSWRAFWFAARDAAADLLRGFPGAEESMDIPAERFMGQADVVEPAAQAEPTTYPADQFAKNLGAWRAAIAAGKATADAVIAKAGTKGVLTDEQKAAIRAPATPASQPVADVAPKVTYAQVADKLNAAKDVDALNTAADLIGEVADADQRKELSAIFDTRNTELQGA